MAEEDPFALKLAMARAAAGAEIDRLMAEALIVDPANFTRAVPVKTPLPGLKGATASNAPLLWADVEVEFGRAFANYTPGHSALPSIETKPCRGCGVHFRQAELIPHQATCEQIKRLV